MRATNVEFRMRRLIISLVLALGFWSPGFRTRTLWSALADALAPHAGGMKAASLLVIWFAAACALLAAFLRTWATAYLGTNVVLDSRFRSERVVAAGPYRFVRNPLYVGLELNMIALAFLMPWWSGVGVIVVLAVFLLRLALAEEAVLAATPGYEAYRAAVPRLLPSLRPRVPRSSARPGWGLAALGEIYFWGSAASFVVFAATFNATTILRWVGVSFGVSLIARAFPMRRSAASRPLAESPLSGSSGAPIGHLPEDAPSPAASPVRPS